MDTNIKFRFPITTDSIGLGFIPIKHNTNTQQRALAKLFWLKPNLKISFFLHLKREAIQKMMAIRRFRLIHSNRFNRIGIYPNHTECKHTAKGFSQII
jgi:hypothetical protein